jgi:acyl dehydratase
VHEVAATRVTRVLDSTPGAIPLMVKAALPAVPGLSRLPGLRKTGGDVPSLTLVRRAVHVDPERVAAYAEVCGFPVRDTLPLTFPHVLAFPLHLALMTDRAFPFAALGTVHLENVITQARAVAVAEELDVTVWIEHLRGHVKGRAYDVRTEVHAGGDQVWQERSTMLVRGRGDEDAPAGLEIEQAPSSGTRWRLPGDLGRRYAAVSGDRNPIHLYGVSAKAFGFPRQIAHGMWSLARCVAALENRLDQSVTVEAAFKTPILLPSTVAFGSRVDGHRAVFSLADPTTGAPHLLGRAG